MTEINEQEPMIEFFNSTKKEIDIEKPAEEDVLAYVQSLLVGTPFQKEYCMLNGGLLVIFSNLTTASMTKVLDWADELAADKTIATQGQYERYIDDCCMYLAINSIKLKGVELIDVEVKKMADTNITLFVAGVEELIIKQDGLKQLIKIAWESFKKIIKAPEEKEASFFLTTNQ